MTETLTIRLYISLPKEASTSNAGLQDGTELIDPKLRQYSDFPRWLTANKAKLTGRKVLMYCTGGVRCERASALLKGLIAGGEDVYQLQGSA